MTRFLKILGALLLAALMTACGGGGGSPGAVSGGGNNAIGGTATLSVTDFALFLNKSSIPNDGSTTASLSVVAVDASRNAVAGAAVSVSADSNSIFIPVSAAGRTDATGTYSGNIGIGGDKSDRVVTVSVKINEIVKQTSFQVVGSKLTLQATPAIPAPGQQVILTSQLLDASANPIPGIAIKLSGIAGLQDQVVTTNLSGVATKTFTAPSTTGIYTIGAKGNGVNASDYQLQVFSSAVPVAAIPTGAMPSLSASPNVLTINSPGSSNSKSVLRFLFVDGANQPIQNVRVRFVDTTTGLPAVGASITDASSMLYTDASGSVSTHYIAGQNSSPTNGVTIKACYSANDFAAGTCPASVIATLTVAGQALSVSIGDDNLLVAGPGTYIKKFAITVADSAGRAVANAPVDISVDLTHYGKGAYIYSSGSPTLVTSAYLDSAGLPVDSLQVVPSSLTGSYPSATATPSASVGRVWCANEDTNRNGIVDPGENIDGSVDSNGQPTLEPRKSDLIVSYDVPTVTTTDATGVLVIKAEYSQRFATWLAYKVRVTANVAGSQGIAERLFVTKFIKGDDTNGGSFLDPPYGVRSCNASN